MPKSQRETIKELSQETLDKVDKVKGVLRLSDLLQMQSALKAGQQLDPAKALDTIQLVIRALNAAVITIDMLRTVDMAQLQILKSLGWQREEITKSDVNENPIGHQFGVIY